MGEIIIEILFCGCCRSHQRGVTYHRRLVFRSPLLTQFTGPRFVFIFWEKTKTINGGKGVKRRGKKFTDEWLTRCIYIRIYLLPIRRYIRINTNSTPPPCELYIYIVYIHVDPYITVGARTYIRKFDRILRPSVNYRWDLLLQRKNFGTCVFPKVSLRSL